MSDPLVGRTVAHYRIVAKLGGGGMGVVYRAEDLHLQRQVALKFISPALTGDEVARERFAMEARAASALDHPAICTIHDIDQTEDGQLFIAMALYEGRTLKERLSEGPLKPTEAIDVARAIAGGLERAHEQGILHRDIKPANVIVTTDGGVKILDFGLAKLIGGTDLTATAAVLGTAPYMAPEQIEGRAVDARADVWALGVVLYEMISGVNPFDATGAAACMAAVLTREPEPVDVGHPDVPAALAALAGEALRKDPDRRLPSAREFRERLDALRQTTAPLQPRRMARTPLVVAATAMLVTVGVFIWQSYQQRQRQEAIALLPRIDSLVDAARYGAAYDLAERARRRLPDDTALHRLIGEVTDTLTIESDPPGATVTLVRRDAGGSSPVSISRVTPVVAVAVPRGDYIVRLSLEGHLPVERIASSRRFRSEPAFYGGGTAITMRARMLPLDTAIADMTLVDGGRYELESNAAPRGAVAELDDYLIDRFEVTNAQFRAFVRAGGYTRPEYWKAPFMKEGKELSFAQAMALFVDRSGLPGPRSWLGQEYPDGMGDHPVTDVTWYEAAAYAAWAGRSLPTYYQWEKAARDGRITRLEGVMMPWGLTSPEEPTSDRVDFASDGTVPVDAFPFGMSPWGAYAMAGNVREWTRSASSDGFLATGGSWKDPSYMFPAIGTYDGFFSASDLGFRCARPLSAGATRDGGVTLDLDRRTPTYHPVDEQTFEALLSHYRYDRRPPRAQVLERSETPDWTLEKVSYDGPDEERVLAYLFLPRSVAPPYQTAVFVPGASAFSIDRVDQVIEWVIAPMIRSGRAVLGVVMKGMVERPFGPGFTPPAPGSVAFRDLMVLHTTEMRMGIDYLETRNDIDMGKLAYIGISFGAGSRLVFAGTDDRFRAVVFIGGGIDERLQPTLPEASNINFAPYIRPPKVLINGSADDEHPWLTRGLPLWNLLREPKQLVLVPGGSHVPPLEARIPAINAFLDKTLGPVR